MPGSHARPRRRAGALAGSRAACSLSILLTLAACGTTRSGRPWGADATLLPGRATLGSAARGALLDPWTWVPLAGAAVLAVDDWDEEVSDWAREDTPVFGSQAGAARASDDLRDAARGAWLASLVATPSGDELGPWTRNKLQGFGVEWSATLVTTGLTSALKSGAGRERPDGSDRRSFPSGHSSDAFTYSTLTRLNLDQIEMSDALRWTLDGGAFTLAAGTAWARVEAGQHFPSDVLAGAALGNLVARFVHDAFLGLPGPARMTAYVEPRRGDWSLGVSYTW